MMMGICLIWVPIGGFRRTRYITSIGLFYKEWEVFGRVSDCEELVVPPEEASRHKCE